MPKKAGFYSELNRFTASAESTEMVAGVGSYIFCSVFGVPNEFALEKIRIIAPDIGIALPNAIDIRILSNPGLFLMNEAVLAGSGESYVTVGWNDVTSEQGPNVQWLYYDVFDPSLVIKDDLNSNCVHFMIVSDAALAAGTTFQIEVEGYRLANLYETTHPIRETRHDSRRMKVLRHDVAADVWHDLGDTRNVLYNRNTEIEPFIAVTDLVYFGMEEMFEGLWFHINDPNTTRDVALTLEYWNGAAWVALAAPANYRNNCSDSTNVLASEIIFAHSGVIEATINPQLWIKGTIDDVGTVVTEPPADLPDTYVSKWIPRYWIRASIDDITTAPTFYWIRPRPEVS